MNSEFLNNLEKSLRSETVPQDSINMIKSSYENYVLEAMARGESEAEIENDLGNPVNLATDFRRKLNLQTNMISQKERKEFEAKETNEKEKRSLSSIFLSLVGVFLINLVAIPVTICVFIALLALFLIPAAFVGTGIAFILYNTIYINGFEFTMSGLTSISLGIGLQGLAIFSTIAIYYLLKWFAGLTAIFYSHQSRLIRRYK